MFHLLWLCKANDSEFLPREAEAKSRVPLNPFARRSIDPADQAYGNLLPEP